MKRIISLSFFVFFLAISIFSASSSKPTLVSPALAACTPGSQTCGGSLPRGYQQCNSAGTVYTQHQCGVGYHCGGVPGDPGNVSCYADAAPTAVPTSPPGGACTPNDRRCVVGVENLQKYYQTCQANGNWGSNETCPTAGTFCYSAAASPFASCKFPPAVPTSPPGTVTDTGCMQCPAEFDTFWNCPFRAGDIPASETCCKRSGFWPLVSYEKKPLVSCSEASCTIPGGCPKGNYDLKCGYDPANPTAELSCDTAIGNIKTTPGGFINDLFVKILGIVGGIAVLLIIISGYRLMASQGNPEKVQGAREQLTAAIVGLLFVIFSLVILQVIGYDILRLPGFNP